jgi:hypothetical protein
MPSGIRYEAFSRISLNSLSSFSFKSISGLGVKIIDCFFSIFISSRNSAFLSLFK